MNKMAGIGLSILGVSILGGLVLRTVGGGAELISEAITNKRRKKLDKLANDPNSKIIKIGNKYYEMNVDEAVWNDETDVEGTVKE